MFRKAENYIDEAQLAQSSIDDSVICNYGIDYLDNVTLGIHPSELVLIGAKSGVGKTSLTERIAIYNAEKGKKVAFFRLEGHKNEFGEKALYNLAVKEYLSAGGHEKIGYEEFRMNKAPLLSKHVDNAAKILKTCMETLFLYDKNKYRLTVENIKDHILMCAGKVDLIIVDHIGFIDMLIGGYENENRGETAIMQAFSEAVEQYNIPVIMVSHIRKSIGKKGSLIPEADEFMGSSNKYKLSYTAIMLSPFYPQYDEKNLLYATCFRIVKSRAGLSTQRVGMKVFDVRRQDYLPGYIVYRIDWKAEDSLVLLERKINYDWFETEGIWKYRLYDQGRTDL
jgi:hypothetical protein